MSYSIIKACIDYANSTRSAADIRPEDARVIERLWDGCIVIAFLGFAVIAAITIGQSVIKDQSTKKEERNLLRIEMQSPADQ